MNLPKTLTIHIDHDEHDYLLLDETGAGRIDFDGMVLAPTSDADLLPEMVRRYNEHDALREQVATQQATITTLTAERDQLGNAWQNDVLKMAGERNAALETVERLTKEVEHADSESDRFASKCIRLQDNARHLETIRALREAHGDDTPWPLSEALVALVDGCEILLRDYDGPNANHPEGRPYEEITMAVRRGRQMLAALDASAGYEQADDVKGGG